MPKGTSRDEATSNSEKIKPIALAVIELRLPEGIRWAGRQAGSKKIPLDNFFFFNFITIYWKPLGLY